MYCRNDLIGLVAGGAHTFAYSEANVEMDDGLALGPSRRAFSNLQYHQCPHPGCLAAMPLSLMEFHLKLCEQKPLGPPLVSQQDAMPNFTVEQSVVAANEELDRDSPTPLENESCKRTEEPETQLKLPYADPVISADQIEPIPPIRTKTVKKRVGGGFVWVTVPGS